MEMRTILRPDVIDELHAAVGEMLGAERRLRSRDKVTEDGMTIAQVRALMALKRKPEATVGDLARFADVTPATMTATLDQLEGAGIVVRTRSPHDRRVVIVSLTEHGQTLVAERREVWEAHWTEAFDDFDDDELRTIAVGLRRIAGIYDAIGTGSPAIADAAVTKR